MMHLAADFVRRTNRNSTIDLVCTRCFNTIATVMDEAALVRAEEQHECEHLFMPMIEVDESQRGTF
jgi:hypothetical protein